jgi:hypothetical protein
MSRSVHGLVLHCFEDELSWGFFLAESGSLTSPEVDIVLGGQVQERWPRQGGKEEGEHEASTILLDV